MKKVGVIHTSAVSLENLTSLFREILPEVEVVNIIDDSLLNEVKKNNGITASIISRMCTYVQKMDELNVDLILNQCSSVGEAFDIATKCSVTKALKIDWPMAEEAVSLGNEIAIIATVESTVKPSCNLVRKAAEVQGKDVVVKEYLVANALDVLMKEKNIEKHNQLVLEAINRAIEENDVVVLAQGSMDALLPYLGDMQKPVLTSPRKAVLRIKGML